MKRVTVLNSFVLLLLGVFLSVSAYAQDAKPKASPPATTTGKVGDATVTVNYSSPSVKGREVWGGLVPYGKVWRAGANEATTVTVDKPVLVEGKQLPAGTYSFYAIPGEEEWTVIFNKTAKQWGTQYDEKQDALRVQVKPVKSATMNERLKYDVTDKGLVLQWENLEVPVAITARK
ncbi:DUF2911 domain-containing protein [Pontibacter akesuensis]|uniref:DUF2911 domain-containing protein n=1 Tax=Pontibacter akesuensis TaxID=388950 RepID=A0A1I7IFC3_9BACT|nr:DUF2911 domain-containing protein [Pontibacter akesuensis]GHA66930.1 hypothetical protein GCM10007389_20020 [Pontibacter akesuensis]SFU71602.1 Protein of unknown function [Pontibacter akesuensis]